MMDYDEFSSDFSTIIRIWSKCVVVVYTTTMILLNVVETSEYIMVDKDWLIAITNSYPIVIWEILHKY